MRLRFPEGMRSLVDARADPARHHRRGDAERRRWTCATRSTRAPFNAGSGFLDFAGPPPRGRGGRRRAQRPTLPLRYDIQIDAPSTLQVRNNSIRLTARADLQLRGTYDRPLLFGRAEIERGEVAFEGRRYLVTRGSIDLSNPTRIEPFFDLETETRVRVPGETYRVTLQASGTHRPR